MPMIGAFMGGGEGAIAAGKCRVTLNWITDDEENMAGAVFRFTGQNSYTATADSNGQATILVDAGEYTVSVEHTGQYYGDSAKSLSARSSESATLTWVATTATQATVIIQSPASYSAASYTIAKGDTVMYSGNSWSTSMTFMLFKGTYTLSLSVYGITLTHTFNVGISSIVEDISGLFCFLTISGLIGSSTLSINGVDCANSSASSLTMYLPKTSSATVSATCGLRYSGASSSDLGAYTPVDADLSGDSATIALTFVGTIVTITDSANLTPPIAGNYEILVVGGGGGGGGTRRSYGTYGIIQCGGGGGSGRMVSGTFALQKTNYAITIGAGGAGQASGLSSDAAAPSGEASSFGTLISASGGDGGTNAGEGGDGGAGGGAGGYGGNKGGAGSYGGGGGGDGAGGTYGGKGGSVVTGEDGGDGEEGTRASENTIYYVDSQNCAGGGGGTHGSYTDSKGGAGGGGGRGARGGAGGTASSTRYFGGCGGGGGVAGGRGGDGGNHSGSQYGFGGRGYGAGGGGRAGNGSYNTTTGSITRYYGGGGGGGGLTSSQIAGTGGSTGGAGAKGAIRLQFIG